MANKQLTPMPAADPLDGTEAVYIVQNGNTRKATAAQIAALAIADAVVEETIREVVAAALVDGPGVVIDVDVGEGTITITARIAIQTVADATYTFAGGDECTHIRFTAVGVLTVPANADVAFPIGTRIRITDVAGTASLAGAVGVTLNSRENALTSAGAFAVFEIVKVGVNTWDVLGDVE